MAPSAGRTCGRERAANYRYPGHEITALSPWKLRQPASTRSPPLPKYTNLPPTFYLSSSILLLTRRFLRFELSLPSPNPGWNYVAWNFDKTGEDSVGAGIRLNLSSYSPRGRKEETFRTEERLARGFEGDLRSMPIPAHTPLFKIPPSFSFLNLSPFALVILPVSLFTGKPPTNTRIEILPFPSRRDFLTYYFLEKLVPGDGLSESWSTKFM